RRAAHRDRTGGEGLAQRRRAGDDAAGEGDVVEVEVRAWVVVVGERSVDTEVGRPGAVEAAVESESPRRLEGVGRRREGASGRAAERVVEGARRRGRGAVVDEDLLGRVGVLAIGGEAQIDRRQAGGGDGELEGDV